MTRPSSPRLCLALALSIALLGACSGDVAVAPDLTPQFARPVKGAGTDVTVTSVSPAYAHRGETVSVRIAGSGFTVGSVASWERGGVADTLVAILESQVVSATELIATVSVKDSATLTLYDVVVTRPDKKKGVATEAFEVTTAISFGTLGGSNTYTYDASNSGAIVGYASTPSGAVHAFVYTETAGIQSLGLGTASAIDDNGTTVGGFYDINAFLFELNGTIWTKTVLPSSRGKPAVFDIAGSGDAMVIGGFDPPRKNSRATSGPALWRRSGGEWRITRLSVGNDSSGGVRGVTPDGSAAGTSGDRAAFWDASGAGTLIGPSGTIALNINSSATVIVGQGSNSIAAYWTRNAQGGWTGPIQLPGNCQYAMAVDDAGNILAHRCPDGVRHFTPMVFTVASGYTTGIRLGGLGGVGDASGARGMSRNGRVIGGQASGQGVRWLDILMYQ